MSSLVLVSGGLDSITALYLCDLDVEAVLFFSYGQINHDAEYAAVRTHSDRLGKRFINMDIKNIFKGSKSSLLKKSDLEKDYEVENRNMIFISIGVAQAKILGCDSLITGIYETDFGDSSELFLNSMTYATAEATEGKVKLISPVCHMHKAEIITNAQALGIDFNETHTCFESNDFGAHCGECQSCINRKKAFDLSGIKDYTNYNKR